VCLCVCACVVQICMRPVLAVSEYVCDPSLVEPYLAWACSGVFSDAIAS
jgi:hypothetical protein